jgi:hypothetical protein
VKFDAPGILLFTAGAALVSHVALSAIVRRALRSSEHHALHEELFAVSKPDWLDSSETRDLRFRYYLPFRALPSGADRLPSWVRATLFAARVSGFCFVCAVLGWFVAVFLLGALLPVVRSILWGAISYKW